MKNKFKIIIVFILITNMSLSTGCWDYREIDQLAIVSGIAVDKSTNGKDYLVSFEVMKISSGGIDSKTTTELIKCEGKTIFEAARNAIVVAGKKLYFSHAKALIISSEVAKEGTTKVIDFFNRHVETRRDIGVYVSKEKKAYDILEQKNPLSDILSLSLDEMQTSGIALAKSPTVVLWNYISDLSSEGISAVLPTISINAQSDKPAPQINGTAIFKKDKLVGFLDGDETNTLLYIQKKAPDGIIVIIKNAENLKVSMEIMNNNIEIKPKVTNGKVLMNISIKMEVAIGENGSSVVFEEENNRIMLEQNVADQLRSNIVNLVKKVQNDYDSDIFGFGKTIKKELPNEWRKMSKDWDNLFKQVDVEVEAEVKIKNTGLNSRPIKVGD
jgi:spore germination protein KC